jgi:hypothetical protein
LLSLLCRDLRRFAETAEYGIFLQAFPRCRGGEQPTSKSNQRHATMEGCAGMHWEWELHGRLVSPGLLVSSCVLGAIRRDGGFISGWTGPGLVVALCYRFTSFMLRGKRNGFSWPWLEFTRPGNWLGTACSQRSGISNALVVTGQRSQCLHCTLSTRLPEKYGVSGRTRLVRPPLSSLASPL